MEKEIISNYGKAFHIVKTKFQGIPTSRTGELSIPRKININKESFFNSFKKIGFTKVKNHYPDEENNYFVKKGKTFIIFEPKRFSISLFEE